MREGSARSLAHFSLLATEANLEAELAMCSIQENAFRPDYAIPPGETLLELLELRDTSWMELAEQTGLPVLTLEGIGNGDTFVTAEIA